MRDRLIELLGEAEEKCGDYKTCKDCIGYGKGELCGEYLRADHLLANGVIVPPCKVGDTVWHIRRTPENMGGSYIVEAKIVCIPIRVYSDEVYSDLIIRYTQRNGMPEEASSKLGKYAFLTKEEAEKELERRKK